MGSFRAKNGVVVVHDIFGPTSQIIQGADRLSAHMNSLVILPDYFKGGAPSLEALSDSRNRAALGEFIANQGDYSLAVKMFAQIGNQLRLDYPDVSSWAIFGLCWGGKVAVLSGIEPNTPFCASGQTHPAKLEFKDAQKITTPHICLASKDEPVDVVAEYKNLLESKGLGKVETFSSMHHGWMGTRSVLANEENYKEYERGYLLASEFLTSKM